MERVSLALLKYPTVAVNLCPGDCVFFSALVLHSSQGNLSPHRRLALASCYTLESN